MCRPRFVIGALWAALAISAVGQSQVIVPGQGNPASALGSGSAVGSLEQQDLFTAGQAGVHTYRIPALCVTNAGTILAVCDARQDDASDLPGNIDLVLRRSTDGGDTFAPPTYIQDLPTDHGVGEASLLVERGSGRVFCMFTYAPPGVGWTTSQAGSNSALDPTTLHARTIWSDDDGLTWSPPLDLNPQVKSTNWRALFTSSGNGIQTRSGRLIQPIAVKGASGKDQARNIYSDDGGLTWFPGSRIANDVNESKAVETGSGGVIQNMRHNSKTARYVAESSTGGASFDPEYQHPQLVDPLVNASLLVHSAKADGDAQNIWIFTNPANTTGRSHLTVQVSYDEGQSFGQQRVVHAGPSAYSNAVKLPDGRIGLLYERGVDSPYEAITFARFDLAWIQADPPLLRQGGSPRTNHPRLWSWLDAGHAPTLNGKGQETHGDPVAVWSDRSGHGVHGLSRTNGSAPTWIAGAQNGLPAVSFDGNADLWGAAVSGGEFQTPSPGITLFAVARVDQVGGDGFLLDPSTGAGGIGLRVEPGNPPHYAVRVMRTFAGPSLDIEFDSADVQLGQFELHTLTFGQQAFEHSLGGVSAATLNFANGGLPVVHGGLVLGSDVNTGAGFEGAIAEVLVYDTVLSPTQRAEIESYLTAKYGL